jgi:hypothetical protein
MLLATERHHVRSMIETTRHVKRELLTNLQPVHSVPRATVEMPSAREMNGAMDARDAHSFTTPKPRRLTCPGISLSETTES